jgi:lipopolysaccharide heptosyltransferase II
MRLFKSVRSRPFRFAVVLNPVFRGCILAWCSGASVRVGYLRDYERKQTTWGIGKRLLTHPYLPREEKIHEVERYLDLLRLFGLTVRDEEAVPRLAITEEAQMFGLREAESLNGGQGPFVVINPGAGWEMRRWPSERFCAIADWLIDRFDARVAFVGGLGEAELIESIRSSMVHASVSYAGRTSLSRLAGLLSFSDLFLTNDTGALHIAAALDVPTVALFGPGDPVKVRPLSPRARVLHHPVPCSPCQVQYTDKCRDNLCMQAISVEEVMSAVHAVLVGMGNGPVAPLQGVVRSGSTSDV